MITAVRLTEVSTEDATAWHAVVAASLASDLPEEPRPTFEQVHAQLTVVGRDNRRLLWLATAADGAVLGVAGLRLFTSPGQSHLAELELHVAPDRRRSGVGSHLLATAVKAAQAEQRHSLVAAAPGDGPSGAFCAAHGFRRVLALDHLLLDVAHADDAEADAEHPGYELADWTGTVPDELAEAFAAAKNAMNDMPTGDWDYGSQTWTADRVRAMAEVLADRGDLLLTTAALHKGRWPDTPRSSSGPGRPAGPCSTTPSWCTLTAATGSGCGSRPRWCAGSVASTPESWRSRPTTHRTTPTCSP